MYPEELKYTAEHEWVRAAADPGVVRMGVTNYAQDALGDVVYVSLPEVGTAVESGEAFGEVESTKSVSDLYAPVGGTVAARNEALDDQPDLINSDPYGEGWMLELRLPEETTVDAALSGYMDAVAYRSTVEAG